MPTVREDSTPTLTALIVTPSVPLAALGVASPAAAAAAAVLVVSVTVAVTSTLPAHAHASETSQRGLSHLPNGRGGGREPEWDARTLMSLCHMSSLTH